LLRFRIFLIGYSPAPLAANEVPLKSEQTKTLYTSKKLLASSYTRLDKFSQIRR